jgi:predicted ATP-grasp superfamily ATP-dependent carboligase
MRILVTDGDNRATLAITRSLGRQHEITVGAQDRRSLASVSRWCHNAFAYPNPAHDQQGFLDTLRTEVRKRRIDVLLPVADITTILIAEHRGEFEPCRIPIPDADTIKRAANKVEIMNLARRVGVPVPAGVTVDSLREGMDQATGLIFPLVVKPGRSRVRVDGHWLSTSVQYANDLAELTQILGGLNPAAYPVLLQERIHGPGVGLFLCCDHGRPIAAFCHQRLREKPPSGGVSVLRESIPVDERARDFAQRLLAELRWHGVAMVEFKRDERDGLPKLMEINGRFWGSLQLAIDAGVDFPALLIQMLEGKTVQAVAGYRTGVRSRWFWGDIDALFMLLLKRAEHDRLPSSQRGRLRAIAKFLKWQGPDSHFEVLRFSDIKPWLLESWHWFTRR